MSHFATLAALSLVGLSFVTPRRITVQEAPQDLLQEDATKLCRETFGPNTSKAGTVLVAIGDETIFRFAQGERASDADADTDAELTVDASIAAAPMAHTFLSALTLQSCARGDLALDAELGKLIPDLVGEDCDVQVRHLMSHTSGFVDCNTDDPLEGASEELIWKRLEGVVHEPLVTQPGECVAPTATDTLLLAAVLEHVDKRPIEAVLATRLFDKLEMTASRCATEDQESVPREATSRANDERAAGFDPRRLYTSVPDLARFQQALIDYELFGEDDYVAMTRPTRLNNGTQSAYCMGLRQISVAGVRGVRSGGSDAHAAAILEYLPEYDLTVAVIGRGEELEADQLVSDLVMLVIAPPDPPIKDIVSKSSELKPYLGTYRIGCNMLIIREQDGRLVLDDPVAGEVPLLNQGDQLFVVKSDPGIQLTFKLVENEAVSFVFDEHGVEATAKRFE